MNALQLFNNQPLIFKDRKDAGQRLAQVLKKYAGDDSIILALPRGGVAVGNEVARLLDIPLEVVVSRKIGAPYNKELGIGALSEGNTLVLDQKLIERTGIKDEYIEWIIREEKEEIQRRLFTYRYNKPLPPLLNRTAIIVDDGLATGVTAEASIKAVKKLHPRRIIFAVPVCSYETIETIRNQVYDFICLYCPYELEAIGIYYQNFNQVTDQEVIRLLEEMRNNHKEILIH